MHETLMDEVIKPDNAWAALRAVERNGGAPGIDGMTTKELRNHLKTHWPVIRDKLRKGTYVPSPVRRKEIAKPGGGTRVLGIPTVQDRFIQQMLLHGMTPIFEPRFSPHSYGFRPGRHAHQAVNAAREYVRQGKEWVVDMDITKFFDHVNHDILMARIGNVIRDKRVLKLTGRFLRRGVLIEGVVVRNEEGTPQGGPLSPLLANIYLDALDKELEVRGHAFCRYADDCNIYVSSEAAAKRTLESITAWIGKRLRLEVNATKSGVGRPWERKFLGFQITQWKQIQVSAKNVARFKDKVRDLWQRGQSKSSDELRKQWCAYVRGWWNYFRLAEDRYNILTLNGWIRRHIRSCFWQRWHNGKGRLRHLRHLGVRGRQLDVARSSKGAWRLAGAPTLQMALSNYRLRHHGFLTLSDLARA